MSKLYLQEIVEDLPFSSLPTKWQGLNLAQFSKDKTLFDFQQNALQNALKGLWLYFKDCQGKKEKFYDLYRQNGLGDGFNYNVAREGRAAKYLLEFTDDFPVKEGEISFAHFINRMSFWMATGSGKTLIIVKLIELLGRLVAEKELPERDILFLTHRDDLLEQFKKHIEEFNNSNFEAKIRLKSLKEYESVKRENPLPFAKNEITVFYYRSDLVSDEHKEKIVDFRKYDNGGKWYILLDEAHKGDKEESKRQILYTVFSRNGFLFNFSATFTDPRDFATCIFNFNLAKFVEEGYGKHIYVSRSNVSAFRSKEDFSLVEKQKIVLKTLLFLTYIIKSSERIRSVNSSLYHRPLLLTLVNSVSTERSDLELFFKELEKVAKNQIRADLLEKAKEELIQEVRHTPKFEFEDLECVIDEKLISSLGYSDILRHVLNAETPGNIEVLKIPNNKNELVFKLETSDRPFALIKIGDISSWLKEKLSGYEINESFDNESYFNRVNDDDSEINVLMGSRAFYEGWDSTRPNVILFVNIGIGSDAKKFVLQSVGRGVRIEPLRNFRRRLQHLHNAKRVPEGLYEKVRDWILPIESLYVFGTNAENLKEIIKTLKEEMPEKSLGEAFVVNPEREGKLLLIPVYRESKNILTEEKVPQKYTMSREDFDTTSQLYEYLGDKIIISKYECEVKTLQKMKETFVDKERYYDFSEKESLFEPELILGRILDYLGIKSKKLDEFKELENEIVHFKKIKFRAGEKHYEEIKRKIEEMRHLPEKQNELEQLYGKIPRVEYEKQLSLFEGAGYFELNNQKIKIKYLANHYYLPVIVSETEKIEYLNHIINVGSEVKFIEDLENYLAQPEHAFLQFDWWMFSKLDQTLDDVFIPYYNPKENKISHFKPDFIFWAQKGCRYFIIFVDPKGTEHTDAQRKIDGYSQLFEDEQKRCKNFSFNGLTVNVKLLLKPRKGVAEVPKKYRPYWFDNFSDFASKILR